MMEAKDDPKTTPPETGAGETTPEDAGETPGGTSGPTVRVVGLGGAGGRFVARLASMNLGGARLAAVNTDARALGEVPDAERLVLGRSVTRGLGTGGDTEVGKAAAEADRTALAELLGGADLLILAAGLGGGAGTAAALLASELAGRTEARVLAFVTLPFTFEGPRRKRVAEDALGELRKRTHGVVSLPNDVLLQEGEEKLEATEAFALAECWVGRGVAALCSLILKTGLVNQDFGSVCSVFRGRGGRTLFGTTFAEAGADVVERAVENLCLCPLLHVGDRPAEVDRLLVHLTGGPDLGIEQVNEVVSKLSRRLGCRSDLLFGALIEEDREGSLELCVLGKAEMEERGRAGTSGASAGSASKNGTAGSAARSAGRPEVEPPIARQVHGSKLGRKGRGRAKPEQQEEFTFTEVESQRGYFEKTDRNLYGGDDLDVPTFLRKGIKIRIR